MVRGPFFDENGIKKGAWSEEEDDKLKSYIHTHGHPNWRQLPRLAGLARCGKSCRLRWMNYLRPNLKHGNYTPQEEQIIIKLHQQYGNKWSLIAEKLPGRTDNDVKNHWHSQLKRTWKQRNINCECDDDLSFKALNIKASHHDSSSESESKILKVVVDDFHNNILESSSLMCTQMSTSASPQQNSASFASLDDVESSLNTQHPSWQHNNKFQQFSGDFWAEPFIPENTFTQYCYNRQIGTAAQHFFSYDAAHLY